MSGQIRVTVEDVYCDGRKALAQPIGLGWFKCQRCLRLFRGIEDA